MKNIGIVGSGIAGLHLGLFLQKHGVDATIYSDRSPDQIRAGRLPNLVADAQAGGCHFSNQAVSLP